MNTDPLKDYELQTIAMAAQSAMAGGKIGIVCNAHSDTPAKFRARIKKDWPQIRLKADGPGPAGGHAFVLVKIDPTEN